MPQGVEVQVLSSAQAMKIPDSFSGIFVLDEEPVSRLPKSDSVYCEMIKLQQVTAPSAFASSSTVTDWILYPRDSSFARVFGNDVG